ncbi:Glycosyl transferase family 8 [Neofusicoccum parvum]|uniref:Glycosyl transferase family protein n=3 Tax=Neofusicoccum TaxID=407951 RepID=A0ABR3SDQ8_9PEZI|nr:putative glycosyl transferase family protein [Neofusicoccum parvum UCRNP2]GME26394.1 Glycosyl transferase family 8 [Neofusicoccum parvum]GME48332.1 Glycosyl transferase family 8 [Neofusicoccum parvum]
MYSTDDSAALQTANPDPTRVVESNKVWTVLITNTIYLQGLFTLDYSLKRAKSKYPLVVLYTDEFPPYGHRALDARGIPKKRVPYLMPEAHKDYSNDPRFYDCWSKLTPFSLVEYDRVVQLDADMLVLKNMDELMDLELDSPDLKGEGQRVFAASHACVCNPLNKSHYPENWVPGNCAFTTQHSAPDAAQKEGAPATAGLGMPNGGLQVVNPSAAVYGKILRALQSSNTDAYEFADQSLLSDVFGGRWVAIPYIYNALKTMRWKGVHDAIWRDDEVKNVHYILGPKPWQETKDMRIKRNFQTESNEWWWEINDERVREEKASGLDDKW